MCPYSIMIYNPLDTYPVMGLLGQMEFLNSNSEVLFKYYLPNTKEPSGAYGSFCLLRKDAF